ncbi:MAG TPA: helix-turn-helix transcriptional regulator [Ferruginibacter sp.]|nr:helix-turn-helix transcriptional regulator [Ferruginibacter sp.]
MLPDKNNSQPGELLKLLRNLKGIKQNDAARKLGVKQQAISKLEKCKKINTLKFDKIITTFNFSKEEIEIAKKFLPPDCS